MSSMTRLFGSAIWFLACCGFALGGEAVTVQGKIEKIDVDERKLVISVPGSDDKIELEVTRKTKIRRDEKDVGIDAIKAGSQAKIKYDSILSSLPGTEITSFRSSTSIFSILPCTVTASPPRANPQQARNQIAEPNRRVMELIKTSSK